MPACHAAGILGIEAQRIPAGISEEHCPVLVDVPLMLAMRGHLEAQAGRHQPLRQAVSYTHLTLPTIYSV